MAGPLDVAERFFTAIQSQDLEAVKAIYAPDAVIWHNTDGLDFKGQSPEENLKTLAFIGKVLRHYHYDVVRREALANGFLQEHVMRGETTLGEPYALAAVIICDIKDGRITRLHEYMREADVAPVMRAAEALRSN